MKIYHLIVIIFLLNITSCSSVKVNTAKSECLEIGKTLLISNNMENVQSISLTLPNNKGSVYYYAQGDIRKGVCSISSFNSSDGNIISTIPRQDFYYFQNTPDGLKDKVKHKSGFWYSHSKSSSEWLKSFVSKET